MSNLTIDRRNPWYGNVVVPSKTYCILEMRPRWIDDTTLHLVLSRFQYYNLTTQARMVSLRRNVPMLDEALKWCAQRRMAVKIETVEVDTGSVLLDVYRNLEGETEILRGHPEFDASKKHASHRLIFKNWENAFEFKFRWC